MTSREQRQKYVWVDKLFKKRLEMIRAKSELEGSCRFNNLGEITKKMLEAPSFEQVEREILGLNKREKTSLKLDKRLWQ